jgi:hypothetical protein
MLEDKYYFIRIYSYSIFLKIKNFFMKKIFLLIAGCISLLSVFSQTKKGSKMIGIGIGSISYTDSKSKTSYSNTVTEYNSDGNSFSISVFPNVGWFIQDGLAIGGSVSVSYYTSKSNNSNTSSTATSDSKSDQPSFYVGPFARYYFGGSSKGMPFAQVNFQYGVYAGKSTSESSSGSSSETKTKPKGDWNAGLTFGYEHFISPYLGFYGSLGVNYGKSKTDYDYKPSSGTGYTYTSEYSRWYVPVSVGLQVHLPSKAAKGK